MKLQLGALYHTEVSTEHMYPISTVCKFIKVTGKGYNFLNIKTNKCIFKNHWYPFKGKEMDFYIPRQYVRLNKISDDKASV